MAKEVETKVLAVDVAKMAKKLKQLGAKQTQKTRLIVDWLRIKGIGEDEDPLVFAHPYLQRRQSGGYLEGPFR
jgi:hypothetical protein